MPKRKREESLDDKIDQIQDRAVRIKASRLKAKIDHGNKSLKSAVQLAKGFERQKLSRRQKQAEKEPHTLLRLREEVIIVKELDASKTARDYLFKQLVKTKRIKESPAFVAMYGNDPKFEGSKNAAEGNVLGRVFKSNPVKEVLPEIMQGIRDVLGLREPKPEADDKARIESTRIESQIIEPDDEYKKDEFGGFSDSDSLVRPRKIRTTHDRDELLDDPAASEIATSTEEDSDGALAVFDGRLAPSTDEEDSLTRSDDGTSHVNHIVDGREYAGTASQSFSGSDDSDQDERSPSPPSKRKRLPVSEPLSKTAFLPSLSMGGYYSGSESDDDDGYTPDSRGAPLPQPRKNRRGQRARQQIAEKKYGSSAKHLVKQRGAGGTEGTGNRDAGWNARRGAVDANNKERKFGRTGNRGDRGGQFAPTGANGDAVNVHNAKRRSGKDANKGNGGKKPDGLLHPSWEAAKKKKLESGNVSFAGKKITFD